MPPFDRRPAGRGHRRLLAPLLRPHAGGGGERSGSCEQALDKYDALHAEGEKLKAEFAAKKRPDRGRRRRQRTRSWRRLMKTKYSHRVEPPRHAARRASATSRRSARAGRWASTSSAGRQGERAAAGAGAVELLLQPERDRRDLPRLPDRRRAGHRRQHRHRDGGDRSVRWFPLRISPRPARGYHLHS